MRALYSLDVKDVKGDRWVYLCSYTSLRQARRFARLQRGFMSCYGTRIRKWVRPNARGVTGWMWERK